MVELVLHCILGCLEHGLHCWNHWSWCEPRAPLQPQEVQQSLSLVGQVLAILCRAYLYPCGTSALATIIHHTAVDIAFLCACPSSGVFHGCSLPDWHSSCDYS